MIFFNKIKNNPFLRNVSTLAFGTIISQIIVVGTSPILTRLFTVESFGVLSLFTSITVIFGVITTGRYELSMGLPEKDESAKNILRLIIAIGLLVSILYFFVILVMKEIVHYKGVSGLFLNNWIYIAPIYTFFIAVYSGLIYWNQRQKKYKKITISNALQVILATLFSLLFGYFGYVELGMIIALVLGIMMSSFFLLKDFNKADFIFRYDDVKEVAKEFKSFPKYMILSDLSLTTGQQFIPIIFSGLFSTIIVGYYSLANRMIRLPNIVLTSSIANVFRNEAIDEIRIKGNCSQLYVSTFKKLIVMSLPIYILVFIFSPMLFVFFFGDNWLQAGYFARILSVLLLVEFVATPLNSLFYIMSKQKIFMKLQLLNTIFGALMIYIGYKFFNSPYWSLALFCINALLFNFIFIFFTYSISKNEEKE
ncbi:lipopolysaccharide biosynthesis protein [Flavobacterium sp. ZE23DGlu08]|uniref:lipopolysaccharide biosynthesis protein n=1 Tax=Flavobacterium sp. ZE23DGlu08 TaxID=3059026 RepID=UPI00265F9C9F|nr:oligosaccharide flippase family protein [Flavobacterium sp. ZE23DGlu08]WKL45051.1 oligosaccharide flippase family protein [Flavobacterium sp. ZE23DGlu08]